MGRIHPMVAILHKARVDKGLERVAISKALGWGSSEPIREYEEGKVQPTLETLDAWAYLLDHAAVMVPRAR